MCAAPSVICYAPLRKPIARRLSLLAGSGRLLLLLFALSCTDSAIDRVAAAPGTTEQHWSVAAPPAPQTENPDVLYATEYDPYGNVYAAGTANGNRDNQTLSDYSTDVQVIGRFPNGTRSWTILAGTSTNDVALSLCYDDGVDPLQGGARVRTPALYVAGYTDGLWPGQMSYGPYGYDDTLVRIFCSPVSCACFASPFRRFRLLRCSQHKLLRCVLRCVSGLLSACMDGATAAEVLVGRCCECGSGRCARPGVGSCDRQR